ncbi:MAG TPA: MraY family glycosyltransferase [Candidatus Sulfotelmatobacter sp.]|nr:MraY family glycosyltransferase [Candidatus Sulfotelmatobacter sp.]
MTVICLGLFFSGLLFAFALTRYVRDVANSRGWVAAPTQERHLHSTPLPRLGGVAIFISFCGCMGIAALWLSRHSLAHAPNSLQTLVTILVPAAVVFLLGVYDDLQGVGPYFKFTVQGVAAAMLYMGGLRIVNIPVIFGDRVLPWYVGFVLTVGWVLAITNAFNLIDGLDGLAAGSALFSTMVAFVVALLNGPPLVEIMTIALAGAILGFLRFNFNPATIFLGDSGSLLIGFLLSAFALKGAQKAPTIVAVAIPIVSFGLPILETVLSIIRRLISGRPVFTADREHIHHKLLQHGLTHRQVVILLYGVSAVFALLSLFLLWPTGSSLGLVLCVLGIGIWIGVQHLGYLEFGELARVAHRTLDQPQIFVNNLAIRRAVEELKVARDYEQVRRILLAAFGSNDFDAFELQLDAIPGEFVPFGSDSASPHARKSSFHWTKPGLPKALDRSAVWTISLDLLNSTNRHSGTLMIHRLYSRRNLQLDVNLLTGEFPTVLADALHRTLTHAPQLVAIANDDAPLVAAQAG